VLLPLGPGRPAESDAARAGPFNVFVSRPLRARLPALLELFEVVWATSWCDDANRDVGPLLGLPRLTVLPVTAHWKKLMLVQADAGDERPVAWADDRLEEEAHEWGRQRTGPTLLIVPHGGHGLTIGHLDDLIAFGARHRPVAP
jgi:hypothetical protein